MERQMIQLSHIKVWDRDVYVKRTKSDKLKTKSDKGIFVGYPKKNFLISIL